MSSNDATETIDVQKAETIMLEGLLRGISGWVERADQANHRMFQMVPSPLKRKLVQYFFGIFSTRLARHPLQVNGIQMFIPPRLVRYYALSAFECEVQASIEKHVVPGMVAIDVGANIGYYSLMLSKAVGPSGKVYAVEPSVDNLHYLRSNLHLNRVTNVAVLPIAAGIDRQQRPLYLHASSTINSLHINPQSPHSSITLVDEVPLDDLIPSPVDFVKLDIEGGEIEAPQGMSRILSDSRQLCLLTEWNPRFLMNAGHLAPRLPQLLVEYGFRVFLARDGSEISDTSELMAMADALSSAGTHVNLFAQRRG